jgi:signal transduction histidine kinase
LINELLDVSRLQEGRLVMSPVQFDLTLVVSRSASEIGRAASREVTVEAPETLLLVADPLRIEQVVGNLIENAIKFSAADRPVEVGLARENGNVLLAVRDHGSGVPPEHRERIFERFYQGLVDQHNPGLGIGLFISRRIVELHGGTLSLESPPDGGSRFVVRLPAEGLLTASASQQSPAGSRD